MDERVSVIERDNVTNSERSDKSKAEKRSKGKQNFKEI